MNCNTTDWMSTGYAPLMVRTYTLATMSHRCRLTMLAPRGTASNTGTPQIRREPSAGAPPPAGSTYEDAPRVSNQPSTKQATVLFTRGSNDLSVAAKNTLDALIGVLRNARVTKLSVTGYASAEWSSQPANAIANNDALARRRAMVVSDYLRSAIPALDVTQRSAVNLSDAAPLSRAATVSYDI